jgi:asparagine synthetase B (glutamine-hydrolysing)
MKPLPCQNSVPELQTAPRWVDAAAVGASGASGVAEPQKSDGPRARVGGHTQIAMSPYFGKPDFSALTADGSARERIDQVSVADILRNAAVFPPHSIFEGIKMATFGFDPDDDMTGSPTFRFRFREQEDGDVEEPAHGWVEEYHQRLCGAIERSCAQSRAPWLLQSGGKDSTTLAIALADVRPETTCITYLGGREENEVESARDVARKLGLRHETLVCDPGRAYDRYLAVVDRMPLLSADFALLSYVDLATEIAARGGDGMIDGQGSDNYFGTPVSWQKRVLYRLALGLPVPRFLFELPVIQHAFKACYLLGTLQMSRIERVFPGSRFTDAEVDELMAPGISRKSRARLALFQDEVDSARSLNEWRDIALSIAGSTGGLAKGLYTAYALSLHPAYPFCDAQFGDWVYHHVPRHKRIDEVNKINKVLVREHIATHFADLPYVRAKGSFRFDLCGLAAARFDTVYRFAAEEQEVLPGAAAWLRRNRKRLDNKYYASKFYLLAIVLPWIRLSRKGTL